MAVDGEPTGGGERFHFSIEQPYGSAQFGCNAGSGVLRIERGWIVPGDWIITVAACLPKERMRFERHGFNITSQPMAIQARSGGGLRLRSRVGSIDLVRAISPAINMVGEWSAVAIDGAALDANDRLVMSITASQLEARSCNTLGGGYRLDGSRLIRTDPWRSTERGCFDPTGKRDVMAVEERGFAILSSQLTVGMSTSNTLRLRSPRGSIDFIRRR